jgi:hypothetical protein
MVTTVYRAKQDGRYDLMCIAEHHYAEWTAKMYPLEQTLRGIPLKTRWNDRSDFVVMEEDRKFSGG